MAEPESVTRSVIGVDVGGTKVFAVLARVGGPGDPVVIMDSRRHEHRRSDGGVVTAIESVVRDLWDSAGINDRAEAVGLGVAGFISLDGTVRAAPNLGELIDVDLRERLARAFEVPVLVDNDANCVAVAVAARRSPKVSDLVAVTLGTGIGAGVVLGGRLQRGAHGFAGEPGHMVLDRSGPQCPCGQRGCWERYGSGSGLARLARVAMAEGRAPSLLSHGDPGELRGEVVTAMAALGDVAALQVLDDFAGWIALGLVNLVNIVDPEVVALGGGLMDDHELLIPRITAAFESYATVKDRGVILESAPSGPEEGAIGAAILAANADDPLRSALWSPPSTRLPRSTYRQGGTHS